MKISDLGSTVVERKIDRAASSEQQRGPRRTIQL